MVLDSASKGAGFAAKILPGAKLYAAENLVAADGSVLARWGDELLVQEPQNDEEKAGRLVRVQFASKDQEQVMVASISTELLAEEPPRLREGQWMQIAQTIRFRSRRTVQGGTPALVLDLRCGRGAESVVVRVAPLGGQRGCEISLAADELEPMVSIPSDMPVARDADMPSGFVAGTVVYSTVDIQTIEASGGATLAVGAGDVGMVFGPALTPEARERSEVLVRFEARQDSGEAVFLNVETRRLALKPIPCRGRKVCLTTPVQFSDGTLLNVGRSGTLTKAMADGDSNHIFQVDVADGEQVYSFEPPVDGFAVVEEKNEPVVELREARIQELEAMAITNGVEGKFMRNVSMLEQSLWAVHGLGTGLNLSFVTHLNKYLRIASLAASSKAMMLRPNSQMGLDGTLENESAVGFDHEALVGDASRVQPYAAAIRKLAGGTNVLDIGTGPVCFLARLCLRAGALSADAIENSIGSVESAAAGLEAEAGDAKNAALRFLPDWATLNVQSVSRTPEKAGGPHVEAAVLDSANKGSQQKLLIYKGLSTDTTLALRGQYSMLVHELLGDMAGNEDAAMVVDDIHKRGLLSKDCRFVPKIASTLLAPTSVLNRTTFEKLLHRMGYGGDDKIKPMSRYVAARFRKENLLAEPQPLEVIDFAAPELQQSRLLEFRTQRAGDFDGVHMHLYVNLDETEVIDVLEAHNSPNVECSWHTLYVRLLDAPIPLATGSRIAVQCIANLETRPARYSIQVSIGEKGSEQSVASFEWGGG